MSSGRGPFGLPKVHEEERRRALEDPGVSWKDWLSSSFAKTYLGLAFFIADGLLIASWFGPPANYPAMIGTTALALYLEYLAWQYLWYLPRAWAEAPGTPRGTAPAEPRPKWSRSLVRLIHPFESAGGASRPSSAGKVVPRCRRPRPPRVRLRRSSEPRKTVLAPLATRHGKGFDYAATRSTTPFRCRSTSNRSARSRLRTSLRCSVWPG